MLFHTGFDTQPDDWEVSVAMIDESTWVPRNWTYQNSFYEKFGVFYGPGNVSDCGQSGVINLDSPVIHNNQVNGTLIIDFDHIVSLEETYDGGVVLIKLNDGNWTYIADFKLNGYDIELVNGGGSIFF